MDSLIRQIKSEIAQCFSNEVRYEDVESALNDLRDDRNLHDVIIHTDEGNEISLIRIPTGGLLIAKDPSYVDAPEINI